MKVKKVKTIHELRRKAADSEDYAKLAIVSAKNLGGNASDVRDAIRWLEVCINDVGDEGLVIDEVNNCLDLV